MNMIEYLFKSSSEIKPLHILANRSLLETEDRLKTSVVVLSINKSSLTRLNMIFSFPGQYRASIDNVSFLFNDHHCFDNDLFV